MDKEQALAFLHETLPREVAFSVHRVEWTSSSMEPRADDPAVRRDPPAYESEVQWSVTLVWEVPGFDQYLEATMDRDLHAAVREATRKLTVWRRAAGRRSLATGPSRLAAPGAAERGRVEGQEQTGVYGLG